MKKYIIRCFCAVFIITLVCTQTVFCVGDDSDRHVIYENLFETQDSLDGCTVVEAEYGKISAENGTLNIIGSVSYPPMTSVLFPVSVLSDYFFEGDITVKSAVSSKSRFSLMFGAKNADAAYNFTVRADSALDNSLEFSYKKNASSWEVLQSGSLSKAVKNGIDENIFDSSGMIMSGTTLHIGIAVTGSACYAYINGVCVLQCRTEAQSGSVGICSSGMELTADNFTVHNDIPKIKDTADSYSSSLYKPKTGMISAPVMIQTDNIRAMSYSDTDRRAAVVMYSVRISDSELCSYDSTVNLGTLENRLSLNYKTAIPAFYVSDMQTAAVLNDFILSKEIFDAYVVSRSLSVIKLVSDGNPLIRGVLDLSAEDSSDIASATDMARKNNITTVILPQGADYDEIRAFQNRLISVWIRTFDKNSGITATVNGCDGIISPDAESVIGVFESEKNSTLTRLPIIISVRGETSYAPENTLRALSRAAEKGADAVLTDVRLTKDGYAVLSLDSVTTGYEKELSIASSGLAALEELACTAENAEESDRITTLDALLNAAHTVYPELVIYLNLRDSSSNLTDCVFRLVNEYGISDRVITVTSDPATAAAAAENGIGSVYTDGRTVYNENDVSDSVCALSEICGKTNSPYTVADGSQNGCVYRLHCSGIRVYCEYADDLSGSASRGFDAVYTQSCRDIYNIPVRLNVNVDDGRKAAVSVMYKNGISENVENVGFKLISGQAFYSDGYVIKDGSFVFYYDYLINGIEYRIYSKAVTTVSAGSETEAEQTDTVKTDPNAHITTALVIIVIVTVILFFVISAVVLSGRLSKLKRKK